jgi:hypothetical protein
MMLVSGQPDMLDDRAERMAVLMDSSEMGRKRWEGVSDEQRKAEMAKVRANVRLTKMERSERARVASLARWAKARSTKPQTDKPVKPRSRRPRVSR